MGKIFGGGTTKASRQSLAATKAENLRRQAFIEKQTGQARQDVLGLFPQADAARNQGIQSAMNLISAGINPQLAAFQQGNVGAQQVLGQGSQNFQNAILGLPTQQIAPQRIDVDTSFLQNLQVPQFQQQTQQPVQQPNNLAAILQSLQLNRGF